MIASLCLFGCGKEKKADKKGKKDMKVAEATIPVYEFSSEDAVFTDESSYAFADDVTDPMDYSAEEFTVAWEDAPEAQQEEFKTVLFDFDKAAPRADQKENLSYDIQLAKTAAEEGKKLVVHGHCDAIGSASYNLALSEKRASTIKTEMVQAGVPAEKIDVVGFGQECPLVWTDAQAREEKIKDLAPNRRAEIIACEESAA
jgi:outer membrane protein OmpA-like peptidoglycan-associated protein